MSKPDWKDAPAWAMWMAQDSDGDWTWFSEKPHLRYADASIPDYWIGGNWQWAKNTPVCVPWDQSLEPRP